MNSGVLSGRARVEATNRSPLPRWGAGPAKSNHPVSAQLLQPGAQRQAVAHHDQALAVRAGLARECLFDGGCDSGAGFAFGLTAAAPYVVSGGPVGPLGGEAAFGLLGGETFPRSEVDLSQAGIQDQRHTQVGSDPGRGRGGSLAGRWRSRAGDLRSPSGPARGRPGGRPPPLGVARWRPGGDRPGLGTARLAFQAVRPCRTAMRHPAAGHLSTSSGDPGSA